MMCGLMCSGKLQATLKKKNLLMMFFPSLSNSVIYHFNNSLANASETLTTKRIAVHIIGCMSAFIQDKLMYKQKALARALQYFRDFNYDLRKIICMSTESIIKLLIELEGLEDTVVNKKELNEQKMFVLREICELIDDEETMVKIEAMTQLGNILPLFSKEEIRKSQVIKALSF